MPELWVGSVVILYMRLLLVIFGISATISFSKTWVLRTPYKQLYLNGGCH